jgi:nicotinate-nucleotide adenylyltransferase
VTERLGIYGGTFDPPHLGHLILAETAADSLDLSCVLFAPAADPPHKAPGHIRVSVEHRLAMVQLAIADNDRFGITRIDVDRPGPHYSVDMLWLLRQEHPQAELFFLIGADSLGDLPTWSRPAELLTLARLGVMRRPGTSPDLSALEEVLPGIQACIRWVDAPLIDMSASSLVARIAAGRSVRYQIPDLVCAYIQEHGLYRENHETR